MSIPILLGSAPVAATGIVAIAAGSGHTCAVASDGGLMCWGLNDSGQLGNGTSGDSVPSPTNVQDLPEAVTAVSLGDAHTCALTTVGDVLCWGENDAGKLGDGTSGGIRMTPAAVSGLESAVSVAAGFLHTCALTTEGGVKCWGSNFFGQLGTGSGAAESALPVDVSGLTSGVAAIAAGGYHTCAVMLAGGVVCWGRNDHGQLGDGSDSSAASTPVGVVGLAGGVAAVAAGAFHTCALTTSGGVACWGRNTAGQLGDGTFAGGAIPVDVLDLTNVAAIAAGGLHTCASAPAGVSCWGRDGDGQLGDGASGSARATPASVVGLERAADLAAGFEHTCAVDAAGVTCWGNNTAGQLGDGTMTNRDRPTEVVGLAAKLLVGDADCLGSVNSIDAAFVLQFDAGLVDALPCPQNADVDGDGEVTSIDAALILQFDAGLIDSL